MTDADRIRLQTPFVPVVAEPGRRVLYRVGPDSDSLPRRRGMSGRVYLISCADGSRLITSDLCYIGPEIDGWPFPEDRLEGVRLELVAPSRHALRWMVTQLGDDAGCSESCVCRRRAL